jgi:hypothetical protein
MAYAIFVAKPTSYIHGDFQTPPGLAAEVWSSLGDLRDIDAVIEPTVGAGAFLRSAPLSLLECRWICLDLNPEYVNQARDVAESRGFTNARIAHADAFDLSKERLAGLDLERPLLAIGNPPWVTSSGQGGYAVQNLPEKSNARFGLAGFDAMTGKANFDIAEAVLLRVLDAVADFHDVRIAFLVKRSVAMKLARRLLGSASELSFSRIDAMAHFSAAVDAGLFVSRLSSAQTLAAPHVDIAAELGGQPVRRAGFRNKRFVEDLDSHAMSAHLEAPNPVPWRQGVKHDVAKILELIPTDGKLMNGFGEEVLVEADVLCPLYKSSDIANGRGPRRLFPLFQVNLSGPVSDLSSRWPLLADYLARHETAFTARRSRIYSGKPPFSIFGVGQYTFAPWKVVVSGLYSTARFRVIGPSSTGHPSLVDDTCYLLPFEEEGEARAVADHLNDVETQQLFHALIDNGAKRPITKALLSRIEIPVWPAESPRQNGDRPQLSLARGSVAGTAAARAEP